MLSPLCPAIIAPAGTSSPDERLLLRTCNGKHHPHLTSQCLAPCSRTCKRHPDELLLRGLMAGGRRPHALLCFAASPPLVFLLLRLTAAIPSSPTHACIPASHTRLLPALTAAAAPASGELCTTPIGTIVARMIGCVASANCSRRVSIRYARDAHALLMLVFPGLAP
eukprot:1161798-Pelagomonas_calceolata.AAC.15